MTVGQGYPSNSVELQTDYVRGGMFGSGAIDKMCEAIYQISSQNVYRKWLKKEGTLTSVTKDKGKKQAVDCS